MSLDAGARLGPYEIISPIGKGGMGEVYRARDTKLERDVAIKVLPDELAADEEALLFCFCAVAVSGSPVLLLPPAGKFFRKSGLPLLLTTARATMRHWRTWSDDDDIGCLTFGFVLLRFVDVRVCDDENDKTDMATTTGGQR